MPMAIDTLAYARRLREAGFSEEQAEGQAHALAAAMTDSLATEQDLKELELRLEVRFEKLDARFARIDDRIDALEKRLDTRFVELESRTTIRLAEFEKRMDLRLNDVKTEVRGEMAHLERTLTMRMGGIMAAGIAVLSAVVKLL
jgi:predicted nuclease with TOPRIM domain